QLLRRQRQRAALGDGGLASAPQTHLEIRREQSYFAALGFDQHVGQNRNRVLAFDDALKKLEFAQEVVLADDEFHVAMTSNGFGGCPGGGSSDQNRRFRGSRNYTGKR